MKPISLANNESALGAGLPAQLAAQSVPLGLYPDAAMSQLRAKLADWYGVSTAEVCVGPGSTDLIFHLVATLAGGGEVLAPKHSFVAYRLAANSAGVPYIESGSGVNTDLVSLANDVNERTRLVCVVNPANPTGVYLEPESIEQLLEQIPREVPVIIDEAYAEFVAPPRMCTGIAIRRRFHNVIVLRTFSKAYGLAGLRVGYAIGRPDWLQRIERRRPPFSVSSPAQAAAMAALDDQRHLEETVLVNAIQRNALHAALAARGLAVMPSEGNFLCVRVVGAKEVANALLHQGVAVLPLDAYGLNEWIRVTVGTPEHNERFVAALDDQFSRSPHSMRTSHRSPSSDQSDTLDASF